MKVRDLLKKLKAADPEMEIRIAGWRMASGVDHAYSILSAKMGAMISDDFDGPVVAHKNDHEAKPVFLLREDS